MYVCWLVEVQQNASSDQLIAIADAEGGTAGRKVTGVNRTQHHSGRRPNRMQREQRAASGVDRGTAVVRHGVDGVVKGGHRLYCAVIPGEMFQGTPRKRRRTARIAASTLASAKTVGEPTM